MQGHLWLPSGAAPRSAAEPGRVWGDSPREAAETENDNCLISSSFVGRLRRGMAKIMVLGRRSRVHSLPFVGDSSATRTCGNKRFFMFCPLSHFANLLLTPLPTYSPPTEGVSRSPTTFITSLFTQLDNLVGIGRLPYITSNYAKNVRNRIEAVRDLFN